MTEIKRIAAELGQAVAAVALAWLRQQPGVTSILVGARSPEELQWNLPALDLHLFHDLSQALLKVTEPVKGNWAATPICGLFRHECGE